MFSRDGESLENRVADPIYDELGLYLHPDAREVPAWKQDLCRGWTTRALPVVALEIELAGQEVNLSRGVAKWPMEHHYVCIEDSEPEPYILDGTWQRFLNEDSDSIEPRVLSGRVSNVQAVLRSAGIDEDFLPMWDPKSGSGYAHTEIYWRRKTD